MPVRQVDARHQAVFIYIGMTRAGKVLLIHGDHALLSTVNGRQEARITGLLFLPVAADIIFVFLIKTRGLSVPKPRQILAWAWSDGQVKCHSENA